MTILTIRPQDLGGSMVATRAFDKEQSGISYREANQTYSDSAPISGFDVARTLPPSKPTAQVAERQP